MSESQKYKFKIVVIGDGGVGKTSLIKKFTLGTFKKDYIKTIGAQFTKFEKKVNGDEINLIFWDIAGQDDFNFLSPLYYKNSKACIIVFSLEENELGTESYKHITNWYNDVIKRCGKIPIVLFANKVDLIEEKDLYLPKLQEVIHKLNLLNYFLTSAKTGQGVNEAFNMLIEGLYQNSKSINF